MNIPKIYIWDENERVFLGEGSGEYQGSHILFDGSALKVTAPKCAVRKIELSWHVTFFSDTKILADHWERGYGDLGWREIHEKTVMPWYFMAYARGTMQCFGVKTSPAGLCWWQIDGDTVSLFTDISCGDRAAALNGRELNVCEVVMCQIVGEAFSAAQAFCRAMCDAPRMPATPIYGGNDWYCNYGDNSYEKIVTHTKRIVECSPPNAGKPYMVIDDGWELCHHPVSSEKEFFNGGPWQYCNRNFGDMAKLAKQIADMGAIPGIWFRPLWTTEKFPERYILKYKEMKYTLDPSVPEVLEQVKRDVSTLKKWGYRLIKHDFTTFDIFGKWGADADHFAPLDVTFADQSRTTAEIIHDLYQAIRDVAGDDVVIIGCNTLSHLSAGIFDIQRTGDDTSGMEWERTKKMGINTLAFRMCQHGAFYASDADCVGITTQIPWDINRKWLDLLAKSGTPLFVSIGEDAYTDEVKADIQQAFARAAFPQVVSQPLDWMQTHVPTVWKSAYGTDIYTWDAP